MKRLLATQMHLAHAQVLATIANDSRAESRPGKRLLPLREKPVILIVDNDLGFLYWLGCTLSSAGYLPLPALKCQDVSDLITRLNVGIDLVVLDSSLPGAGELIVALERSQRELKVIAVIGEGAESNFEVSAPHVSQYRRPCADESMETVWLETVRGVMASEEVHHLQPD